MKLRSIIIWCGCLAACGGPTEPKVTILRPAPGVYEGTFSGSGGRIRLVVDAERDSVHATAFDASGLLCDPHSAFPTTGAAVQVPEVGQSFTLKADGGHAFYVSLQGVFQTAGRASGVTVVGSGYSSPAVLARCYGGWEATWVRP